MSAIYTKTKPSAEDGLALSTALFMLLCRDKAVVPGKTFKLVNSECHRLHATRCQWATHDIRKFVLDGLFAKLGSNTLSKYFHLTMQNLDEDEAESFIDEVMGSAIMYYLVHHGKCSTIAAATELAVECKLDAVLKNKDLGGCANWSFDTLITSHLFSSVSYPELRVQMHEAFIDEIAFVGLQVSDQQRQTTTWSSGGRSLVVKTAKGTTGGASALQPEQPARQTPTSRQPASSQEASSPQRQRRGLHDVDETDADVLTMC